MAEYTFHPSVSQDADTRSSRASAEGQGSVDRALRDNEGLVHTVIRREGSGALSYEEALQAGRIGLWRALLGYDPARGTAFSTYAWVAIRRHIRRAATQSAEDASFRALSDSFVQAVDPPGRASRRSIDEELDHALVHDALRTLVFELPDRLLQIIVARYGLDGRPPRSLRQLGVQLGLSHERVRQLQQEALAWLRHPVHSLCLRQRLDKNTVAEYRRALALNAALRRARRRHKR
jgi:RNA polymerase sigma factor (sigma-70 family)